MFPFIETWVVHKIPDDNGDKINANNNFVEDDDRVEADDVVYDKENPVLEMSPDETNNDSASGREICLTQQKQGSSQVTPSLPTLQTLFGPLDPDLLEDSSMESEEVEPLKAEKTRQKLKRKTKTKIEKPKRLKMVTKRINDDETSFDSEEERKKFVEELRGSQNNNNNIKDKVSCTFISLFL